LNTHLDNPTYTYKGYRLQALYTIYKIFTSPQSLTFEPEGVEDFAIYNNKKLITAIQVKSGNNSLSLKDFKNSFFERLVSIQSVTPDISIQIVKFGSIGAELKKTFNEGKVERQKVISKLLGRKNFKCNKNQLEKLFTSIEVIEVSEENVYQKVDDILKDSLLGINKKYAFDLIINWIYNASEKQILITQSILKEKIINIGKFLKSRESYHQKWFSVIEPIELLDIDDKQRDLLSLSYYQGESAKILHIQLNLDARRLEKLQMIQKLHSKENILFIHGASGQGKSTLAYRYIHDFYPESWCFEIKLTESRTDALESALAISEYAKTLDTYILVYMDVSPHDTGWEELVKSLSKFSNIKVLITIREEDWKRSYISGVEFSFNEFELKFNEEEAKEIFQILFAKQSIKKYLNFEDTWDAFGKKGSLLEFVYLVTQGGRLKERLQSQVNNLIDEDNNLIISILRCVAVATASGARINVKKTIEYFKIAPELLFKRLESEYFLRIDDSKKWIEAYHPLRSVILEEILIDEGYAPWIEEFHKVWQLIHEDDIDIFLFHAFLNHFNQREEVFSIILDSNTNNWISIEKILKVLVWLSVKVYVEDNLEYIKNIFNTVEGHFVITLGADIANIAKESVMDIFNLTIIPEERRSKCLEVYNHLGLDNFKPIYLIKYLKDLLKNISIPNTDEEWYGLSKVMLWSWKYNIIDSLSIIDKNSLENSKISSTKTAIHFATSLYLIYPESFFKWKKLNRKIILEQLCKEENIIGIEETEANVKVHFLTFDLTEENKKDSNDEANIIHAKTISLIDILHKIFPEKQDILTQGYGHLFPKLISHDETIKRISRENLHIKEFVELNALFRGIINNHFRSENWNNYTRDIFIIRKQILEYLNLTIKLVEQYFQSKTAIDPLRSKSSIVEEWNKINSILNEQILLPITAVDKLGFFNEDSILKKDSNEVNNINLSIKRYAPIQKILRNYKTDLGNFFSQAASVFDINFVTGKLKLEDREEIYKLLEAKDVSVKALNLSWINLLEGMKNMLLLQKEFDNIFSAIVEPKSNDDLKAREISTINKLGKLWYFYIHNPNIKTKVPQKEIMKRFEDRKKNLLKEILSLLNKNEMETKFTIIKINDNEQNNKKLQVKVENKLAIYSWHSCFEAILKTSEYIHKLSLFGKTVLEWNWEKILFIPISNNYTINNLVIPMPTNQFLLSKNSEELNIIQHIPRKLTAKECKLLKIHSFSSHITDSINEIFELTTKLFLYVTNLKDLKNFPYDLDYGEEVIINYVKNINTFIDNTINHIIDKLSILQSDIKEKVKDKDDIYIEFISELSSFWKHLYPDSIFEDNTELNMDELQIWSNELEQATGHLMSLYPLAIDFEDRGKV